MNPFVTFLVPMHFENDNLLMFIGAMKSQTNPNFKVIFLHNGDNNEAAKLVETLCDNRFMFVQMQDTGFWGCYNRQGYLKLVDTEFVIQTSVQDYYIPTAVEEIYKYSNVDFLYWNSINHIFGYSTVLNSTPNQGRIDWGNFMIKTSIAIKVGIKHPEEFRADGLFVEECILSGKVKSMQKINTILTIHN